MADALTSVLAIGGLLAGKYAHWLWIDPLIGILGALMVARWSLGLLKVTSAMLLDQQSSEVLRQLIQKSLTTNSDQVVDLHVWRISPDLHAVEATILSGEPQSPTTYRQRLPQNVGLAHIHIEVHRSSTVP